MVLFLWVVLLAFLCLAILLNPLWTLAAVVAFLLEWYFRTTYADDW